MRPAGTTYNLGSGGGSDYLGSGSSHCGLIGSSPSWTLKSFQSVILPLLFSHQVMSDSLWRHGLYRPPCSSVCGVLLARILEWVAMSFSRASSPNRNWTCVSCFTIEPPRKPSSSITVTSHCWLPITSFAYSNFSLFAIAVCSLVFLSHMSISSHGTNSLALCLSLF